MRKLKFIVGILFTLAALAGCNTSRQVQKSSFRTDSTATEVNKLETTTSTHEQASTSRQDSAYANGQNKYQRQTLALQFAPTLPGLPSDLQNKLIGLTLITEQGTQAIQTGNITHEQTSHTSATNDSLTSVQKKSTHLSKTEESKQSHITRKVGNLLWWFILFIVIVCVSLLIVWKGRPLIDFIKEVIRSTNDNNPPTPPMLPA